MAADLVAQLLSITLSVSAAVLLIALLRQPLRRWLGARVAYGVWAALPLVLLASLLPGPKVPSVLLIAPQSLSTAPSANAVVQGAAGSDSSLLLLSLWTFGAAALVLFLIAAQLRFQRQLGALQADAHGCWRSARIAAPALLGLWRSRIVLPSDFEQRYNAREQALVIAHEQAHRRHGDPWANVIASVIGCLLWFNPLLWWAMGRFRFDQELACDARVLETEPEARRDYAAALLKSQLSDDANWRLPLGCHWQSSHPLKERISMLRTAPTRRAVRALGSLLTLSLCSAAACAAWAVQPAQPLPVADGDYNRSQVQFDMVDMDRKSPEDPVVARAVPPKYPRAALEAKQGGSVLLHVEVNANGEATDVMVKRSEPIGVFDASAVEAVKQWKFQPGVVDGKPVGGAVLVPISFSPEHNAEQPGEQSAPDEPAKAPEAAEDSAQASRLADGTKSDPRPLQAMQTEDQLARPVYPRSAMENGLGGEVVLKVQVLPDGSVGEVLVESATPQGVFEKAAIKAAKSWKLNPDRRIGLPVVGWLRIPVRFTPDFAPAPAES